MTVLREKERRKNKGLVKFCYKPSEGEKEERERERACGMVLQLKDRRRAQGTAQDRPRWSR